MTSTITAAYLAVTVTESISLNGVDFGAKNTLSIGSVTRVMKRIVAAEATEKTILAFGASVQTTAGSFLEEDVRYIRITNLDDTNWVALTFKSDANLEFAVMLDKGESYIYNASLHSIYGIRDTMFAADGSFDPTAGGILGDLVDVTAKAHTASCDLEVFVASA